MLRQSAVDPVTYEEADEVPSASAGVRVARR